MPPKSKTPRDIMVNVRLTAKEAKELRRHVKRNRGTMSGEIRLALVEAGRLNGRERA